MRAEESGLREKFEVVTGRAVAPLAAQLEISAAPCSVGGIVLPMRTANEQFDNVGSAALGLELTHVVNRSLADSGIERAFPIYKKQRRTDRKYPRRWAEIKANPLTGS